MKLILSIEGQPNVTVHGTPEKCVERVPFAINVLVAGWLQPEIRNHAILSCSDNLTRLENLSIQIPSISIIKVED